MDSCGTLALVRSFCLSPPGLRDVTDALAPGGGVGTATAITGVGAGTAVQLVVAAETREAVVATATIGRER